MITDNAREILITDAAEGMFHTGMVMDTSFFRKMLNLHVWSVFRWEVSPYWYRHCTG